jgi:predicted nucleotidyltransferase
MDAKIQNELDVISDIIVKTVPVDQIYLFGSYAYGTPNENSDLDIYVVLKDDAEMHELDAIDMIGIALYKNKSMPTDVMALKKNRFNYRIAAPTLEREVVEKGVLIYGQ